MVARRAPDAVIRFLLAAGLWAGGVAVSSAQAQPAGVPPLPKPRLETHQVRAPAARVVWQPGHWEWDVMNARYVWHHGRHVVRRPGAPRFVAGRWVVTGGEWAWRRAKWK